MGGFETEHFYDFWIFGTSVSQLTGLSQMGVVSWSALLEFFLSKVDSIMESGYGSLAICNGRGR